MQRRNTLLTTNAIVSAALVAALLVALYYLGTEHHVRWDLTATREHSLSPQTIKVLRSLPGPIEVVAFPSFSAETSQVQRYRRVLATYQYYSKNFQFRIVDPDRDPAEAQKLKITSYGQIVLTRGKASYTVDSESEEQLTNGLLHLLETAKKTVYVLQGEGEIPLDDFTRNGMGTVKQALVGKGFDVRPLLLVQTGRVPEDATGPAAQAERGDDQAGGQGVRGELRQGESGIRESQVRARDRRQRAGDPGRRGGPRPGRGFHPAGPQGGARPQDARDGVGGPGRQAGSGRQTGGAQGRGGGVRQQRVHPQCLHRVGGQPGPLHERGGVAHGVRQPREHLAADLPL